MIGRWGWLFWGLLLAAVSGGCATHADHLVDARAAFYRGDLAEATAALDRQLARRPADRDVLLLERALVDLTAGRPAVAETTLREVRDSFDYLEQQSLAESALVMLTDDNRAAYAGENYEKVLLRALLALSNLMHDGGDAAAYGLQVDEKQNQIIASAQPIDGVNPKLAYQRVALGAYIHGALREATHADYDDAARCWAKVVSWEPDFRSGPADLERARHGHHSAPGNGVLYVFTLVGRGPYKTEAMELPSTAALLIADRILSHTGEYSLPPTIAPIKVPAVVLTANRIRNVEVAVDGRPLGATETVSNVGRLALEQYQAVYPQVLARAVVRRVVKKGIVYAGKEALNVGEHSWVNLLMDVGGVVWEATESADTRCWGLLPDRIQVLRVELPAGQHQLALRALGAGGPLGPEAAGSIPIADGRNTYVLANFPADRLVGTLLVSGQ